MSSAKRKPSTPSPLLDEGELEELANQFDPDFFAGRPVSVTDFEGQDILDCEDVASPGASSTCSEPTYIRQPGFTHHAHEVPISGPPGNPSETIYANHHGYHALSEGLNTNPSSTTGADPMYGKQHGCHYEVKNKVMPGQSSDQTYGVHSSFDYQSNSMIQAAQNMNLMYDCNLEPQYQVNETNSVFGFPYQSTSTMQPVTAASGSNYNNAHLYNYQDSRNAVATPSSTSVTQKAVKKKKKTSSGDDSIPLQNVKEKSQGSRPKVRHKEPLPMKLRALPQSFWVQPNRSNNLPPSGAVLPPLQLGKDTQDVAELTTPPEEVFIEGSKYSVTSLSPSPTLSHHSLLNLHHSSMLSSQPSSSSLSSLGGTPQPSTSKDSPHIKRLPAKGSSPTPGGCFEKKGERIIKVGNTDLLFRLFDKVEANERKKLSLVRRGRPKKTTGTMQSRGNREEDPCLSSPVADGLLPLLTDGPTPLTSGAATPQESRNSGMQVLEMVSLRDGDRTISLPSLNVEHNYNQLLTELVMKL